MTKQTSRRDMIKGSVALAGLGVLGLPEWAFPALTQDQTLVRFTDLPSSHWGTASRAAATTASSAASFAMRTRPRTLPLT